MISYKPIAQTIDTDSEYVEAVIKTLRYFNIFKFPLYLDEIHKFLELSISKQDLQNVLTGMLRAGTIFYGQGMYSLENSSEVFLNRLVATDLAAEKIREAGRSAAIIASFPFVRAICISGSLSKGYADERSDIDFFIVTAHRRLWICRTMLHLFKKATFLVNKQHSFCMNYFIDESELCLEEKNVFTATELSTIIPVYNLPHCRKVFDENADWIKNYFPNTKSGNKPTRIVQEQGWIKRPVEYTLNKMWPEQLNHFLMRLTDKLWRHKWERRKYPMEDYDIAMKTKWYVSKHHPLNYQKKVLAQRHDISHPDSMIN